MGELKKEISYPMMLFIVINSLLGTGIFFLPAAGAGISGPASIIAWGIFSVIAVYIAMCFGELCSMYPTAGGIYEFSKNAYGRFPSFLIGITALIAANLTISMLVVGAIQYLLPYNDPTMRLVVEILSIAFIILFNIVAYRGIKVSVTLLVAFAFITIGALVALTIPAFFHFHPENYTPFFTGGPTLIFLTIFIIAETFFGWESPCYLAGETKDGEKTMPKALIIGTILIAIISLTFVIFAIGTIPPEIWAKSNAPLVDLAIAHYGAIGLTIFTLIVYLAIIGSVADWVVSSPRLILSMAKDKLFFSQMAEIHPKFGVPHRAIIFQMIISIIFVHLAAGYYNRLLHLLLPLLIFLYSAILISVVVLRYKKPDQKRYYRAPFGKVGPIIVSLIFIGLLISWIYYVPNAVSVLLLAFSFILVGIPVYFLMEMYHDPKAITKVNDALTWFSYLTEKINLPRRIRKEILYLLGNIKGKKVLEYGCNVGTLTEHLAIEVGPDGKIYATDFSKKHIYLAKKRMERKKHKHVMVMHDEEHHTRIHPHVPHVDAVVSVGTLGYVQDVDHVLKDMNKRLKKGDRIVIMEYDKFFDFIPNIPWLSHDEEIQKRFLKAGFNVGVIRKQGFAWQYVYIYGVKEKSV